MTRLHLHNLALSSVVITIHKAWRNLCAGHTIWNYGMEEMVIDAARDCIQKALRTYSGKQCQALQGKHESEGTSNIAFYSRLGLYTLVQSCRCTQGADSLSTSISTFLQHPTDYKWITYKKESRMNSETDTKWSSALKEFTSKSWALSTITGCLWI